MSRDPVSANLPRSAPIADADLLGALARYEELTVTELQAALTATEAELRRWASAPENAGRPIAQFPAQLDRIAIDTLLERRMWAE